jgi:membrane-associated protease RseP (regulator of RpoE activity)
MSYIGRPFSGFDPIPSELRWWYSSSFVSDGIFWSVLQVTFWIFWLNLVLGVTNALPAVPFDGGYLFRDGIGALIDRTKKNATQEQRDKLTNTISSVVSYAMLFALLLVMMAMIF